MIFGVQRRRPLGAYRSGYPLKPRIGEGLISNLDSPRTDPQLATEGIYLNSFRIALPVAFPAARRPTRFLVGGRSVWPEKETTKRSIGKDLAIPESHQ
jgi:hypothetical protein